MPSKKNARKQRENATAQARATKITLMYALPDEYECSGGTVTILKDLPRSKEEMTRLHHALGLDTMNDAQLKAIDDQYGLGVAAYHFPYDLIDAAMPEALMGGDGKEGQYVTVHLEPAGGEAEGLPADAKGGFTVEGKVVAVIVPKAPPIETAF